MNPQERMQFVQDLVYPGGLSIIPIRLDMPKTPAVDEWKSFQQRRATPEEIIDWYGNKHAGIAIVGGAVSGNLEDIDFDVAKLFPEWCQLVMDELGEKFFQRLVIIKTPMKGFHVLYRCPEGVERSQKLARDTSGKKTLIETKSEGGYFLTVNSPPECHEANAPYEMIQGNLLSIPELIAEEREVMLAAARSFNLYIEPEKVVAGPSAGPVGDRPGDHFNSGATWEEILEPHGWSMSHQTQESVMHWTRPGKGKGTSATTGHNGHDVLYVFSSNAGPFEDGRGYTKFSAYALLNHDGNFSKAARKLRAEGYGVGNPLNDIGNAQRFVENFGDLVRWCPINKCWLVWDGKRWKVDDQDRVVAYAKETARRIFLEAADCEDAKERKEIAKWANSSCAASRVEAMLKLVKPDLAVTPDMLDRDQFKFNCINGTVDLRTGLLLPHRQEDYITKLSPVAYRPDATAPRFEQFLHETFDGKQSLEDFVQSALGYSMTGSVKEQKLFVCWGDGQNGKSTLFGAAQAVMGDYAQAADPTLLTLKQKGNGATEEIARLKGVRLATTIETNEGERLDEARLKQITGGDRLTARYMYGHLMEFDPTHKLFMITNYIPQVSSQAVAVWRRIRLIPFTVQVPEHKKDKNLPDKLLAEAEGIFAWLVRGCLKWQEQGLPEPPEVENATADYKAQMDSLERFIDERCCKDSAAQVQSSTLRNAYKRWCEETGEVPYTRIAFGNRMREKGYVPKDTSKCTVYPGLRLITMAESVLG